MYTNRLRAPSRVAEPRNVSIIRGSVEGGCERGALTIALGPNLARSDGSARRRRIAYPLRRYPENRLSSSNGEAEALFRMHPHVAHVALQEQKARDQHQHQHG